MGRVVEALEEWKHDGELALFLGGGITNCSDWQQDAIRLLTASRPDLVLLNPRRANFPMGDPAAGDEQILWEQRHIKRAQGILFWFPKETLCPITLFELGRSVESRGVGVLFVGCDPAYQRRFDLEVQLRELRPEIEVHLSLPSLCKDVTNTF